jgi:predicted XRE-type DNA-binding protein
MNGNIRPLRWVGSAKKDLMSLPDEVRDIFGYALFLAQTGRKHIQAKPLKGFGSAGVLEVVERFAGNAYRAVYTVRFANRGRFEGKCPMSKIEHGSSNVYNDLGYADAEGMLVKAALAAKIAEIVAARGWSQQEAGRVLGIPQPKLSKMLRGQFRGISEAKMLECLTRLGRDIQIVIGSARRRTGRIDVVSA